MSGDFIEHLNRASEIVSSWPEWKQNILGGRMDPISVYDDKLRLYCPNRQYCEWAAALFRLGSRPTGIMRTVYDLMLSGF